MDHCATVHVHTAPSDQIQTLPPDFFVINFSYTKVAQITHPRRFDRYIPIISFDSSFGFEYPSDFPCGCILREQLFEVVPISSELLDDVVVPQILSCVNDNRSTFNEINVTLRITVFNSLENVNAEEYASEDCSICLDKFFDESSASKEVVRSKCCHVFHQDCILRWLNANNYCPLCRHQLSWC